MIHLYKSYGRQIIPFRDMENALYASLRYMDKSDDELIEEGIDIPTETSRINKQLQSLEKKIEQAYNERGPQDLRLKSYKTIEAYLFSSKEEKKNEV